jgi:hypothetical protein
MKDAQNTKQATQVIEKAHNVQLFLQELWEFRVGLQTRMYYYGHTKTL